MRHIHRAIKAKSYDRAWNHCVTPFSCASDPLRQEAHGNITQHDTCSCGATRQTEINAGRKNYGPWMEEH